MSRRRKLLFACLLWGLVAAAGEVALRQVVFAWEPDYTIRLDFFNSYNPAQLYQQDPDLLYRHRKRPLEFTWQEKPRVRINSEGFRGPERTRGRSTEVYRVLCIGNSVTFGLYVEEHETFAAILRQALEHARPGRRIEVINAGVAGYTSFQGRRYLERELSDLDSDLIVVEFGINDASDGGFLKAPDSEVRFVGGRRMLALRDQLRHSRLFFVAETLLTRLRVDILTRLTEEQGEVHRVSIEEYAENLRAIADLARAHGAEPIFLNLPYLRDWNHPARETWWSTEYARMMDEAAWSRAVPVVRGESLFPLARIGEIYDVDNMHPNALGHRRIADELLRLALRLADKAKPMWETESEPADAARGR